MPARLLVGIRRAAWRLRVGPVTGFVLATNVLTFLTTFFAQRFLFEWLVFDSSHVASRPWSVLTYPLVNEGSILGLLLTGYVFWWVGRSLESEWGSREFGLFVAAVTALTAGVHAVGGLVLGHPTLLLGLGYPLAAIFLAWCMTHPDAIVLLMLVLPVRARWLGWLDLVVAYFLSGPVMGLFVIATPLAAWWYGRRGRFRWRLGAWRRRRVARPVPRHRRRGWTTLLHPVAAYRRRVERRHFERRARDWQLFADDARRESDPEDSPPRGPS